MPGTVCSTFSLCTVHERDIIVYNVVADGILKLRVVTRLQLIRVTDFVDYTTAWAGLAEGLLVFGASGYVDRAGATLDRYKLGDLKDRR